MILIYIIFLLVGCDSKIGKYASGLIRSDYRSDDESYPVDRNTQMMNRQGRYMSVEKEISFGGKKNNKNKEPDNVNVNKITQCDVMNSFSEYLNNDTKKINLGNLSSYNNLLLTDFYTNKSGITFHISSFVSEENLIINMNYSPNPKVENNGRGGESLSTDSFIGSNNRKIKISLALTDGNIFAVISCKESNGKICSGDVDYISDFK